MYAIILALALQAQILFAANGLPCGGNACASYYDNIPGQSVSDLKAAAKFPGSPDSVITLESLDVPEARGDDYGVVVTGWVLAPQSGTYTFSTRSDDSSEVWISTTAGQVQAEADMVKVVELAACCEKVSGNVQVQLEEGESYYLLGYMKEGPGNDYFQIGMTVNGVEYFPISELGYVAPASAYTLASGGFFHCGWDNQLQWSTASDVAQCQQRCTSYPSCVAVSWQEVGDLCVLHPICDELTESPMGFVVYRQASDTTPSSAPPAPVACSGSSGSEYTEKTLAKLDEAQEKFGNCDSDIRSISSSINKLSKVSTVVETATNLFATTFTKIDSIKDKILKDPPVGFGVASILGKIPKVGIFIKMGLKTIDKVIDGVEPLAKGIENAYDHIDTAVKVAGKTFLGMKLASTPTALYLKGSHAILDAAHDCGLATGYQCGTASAIMEHKNAEEYPEASQRLEDMALVGQTCHDILNPMDAALRELALMAEKIGALLQPIVDFIESVEKFLKGLDDKLNEFMAMINDSDELQCALEIFEPVTDTINLLTCPIDEVVGFVMHELIGAVMGSLKNLVNTAAIVGINTAVEALVPDQLYVHIPDFTAIIPVDFWVDTCNVAAVPFPEYSATVGVITNLELPMTFTGREIKDSILTEALEGFPLVVATESYESACKEAWNEMGTDFEHCEKVLDKIADALVDAECDVAIMSYNVELELVKTQQDVYDAALGHFQDAQKEFVKAQDHLNDVQEDLFDAIMSVENTKKDCPNCRCGGCAWHDIHCHVEGTWCCPAKHACLGALNLAQGGIAAAQSTVSLAQGSVAVAQVGYEDASRELSKQQQVLKYHRQKAEAQKAAKELICNPPMFEVVQSGDCVSNGLTYITERNECILAGRLLGVTHHHDPQPSGNRQKLCGTWTGMAYLHFNTQLSGVLPIGNVDHPILQTAGFTESAEGSFQICKRRGSASLPAPAPGNNDPQCSYEITVEGEKYGEYSFTHSDSCDATFYTRSAPDSEGYTCTSRFGLKTGVLMSSTGSLVGPLSCDNQSFTVSVQNAPSYTIEHDKHCWMGHRLEWTSASDASECQQKCTARAGCVAVSWQPAAKHCVLHPVCDVLDESTTGFVVYHQDSVPLGCFVDDTNRDLDVSHGSGYTPRTCRSACTNYRFFSLQYGGQCFCGDSYGTRNGQTPQYHQTADNECSQAGESWHQGGAWRNAVYRVDFGTQQRRLESPSHGQENELEPPIAA